MSFSKVIQKVLGFFRKTNRANLRETLVRRYGSQGYFSSGQLTSTMDHLKFTPDCQSEVFAMFSEEKEYLLKFPNAKTPYETLRQEIAETFFPNRDYIPGHPNFFSLAETWYEFNDGTAFRNNREHWTSGFLVIR